MSALADPRFILPLATIDDVRDELADTERSLNRLGETRIVDPARLHEKRDILVRWRDRLTCQLEAMEATHEHG